MGLFASEALSSISTVLLLVSLAASTTTSAERYGKIRLKRMWEYDFTSVRWKNIKANVLGKGLNDNRYLVSSCTLLRNLFLKKNSYLLVSDLVFQYFCQFLIIHDGSCKEQW